MTATGRILAVDPGSRRIGLAISDEDRTLASPLSTVVREGQDVVAVVAAEVARLEATVVVVGLPLRLDGSAGPEAQRAQRLADALRARTGREVVLFDERFTSVMAERLLKGAGASSRRRRLVRDQAAATVLLQSYLDGLERDA